MAADGNININAEITPKVNLRELQGETDKLRKSLDSLVKNTKGIPSLDKTRDQAVQASRQMEQLQRSLEKALNQKVPDADYVQITRTISELEKELAKTEKQIPSIKTKAEQAAKAADAQIATLEGKAKSAEAEVAKLQQELQKAMTVQSKSDAFAQLEKELASWEKKRSQAEARITKMETLGTDKTKAGNYTKAYDSALYDYNKADDETKRIKAQMQQLVNAGQHIKIGDPKAVAEYQQKLTDAKQKSSELNANLAQAKIDKADTVSKFNNELTTAEATADKTKTQLNFLNQQKQQFEKGMHGPLMQPKDTAAVDAYSRALAVAKQNAQILAQKLRNLETANKIFNGLATAARAVAKAFSKIVSAARTIRSSLQKIGSSASKAFNSMRKSSDKSHKHMMRNIIQYVLGFRSLFFLVRRLRKVITDDFGAMAKSIPEFNKTMSELYNTFNQLKGSLGTALQPILTAITPVLLEIMNMAIDAANAVGTFFATLTGQGVIYKAVKGNADYAKSLDKSTKSTKKNKKAQKDLIKELGEYDKLSVIKKDKTTSSSSSSKKDDELKYEAVAIDKNSDISKLAAKIRKAWNKQDWKGLGKIMGTTINDLVNKINDKLDWNKVGPKIKKWVHNIGTAFNSLMTTVKWKKIGKTFGNGINTLTNTINSILLSFDIPALGTALADIVNSANKTVDWNKLGRTAALGLNTITTTVNNFVDKTNWKSLGKNLADSLVTFIEAVEPTKLGKALSSPIKALTNTFNGFLTNFTEKGGFNTTGIKLGKTVNAWFSNINWKTIGTNIKLGINGVVATFRNFLTTTNWTAIGADLAEIINGIFDIDWESAGALISDIAGSLLDTVTSLLDNVNWEDIGSAVIKLISGIKWSDVISKYYKAFGSLITALVDVITGLLEETPKLIDVAFDMIKGIISGVSSINWSKLASSLMKAMGALVGALFAVKIKIATHIIKFVKSIITGIGDWFKKKKKECAKNGENIVWGILKGIWNVMKNITKWIVKNIFKPFINGFKKAFGIASPSKKMKKMGGYIIDGLKAGIGNVWDSVKGKFDNLFTNLEDAFDNAKETVLGWWDTIKGWFGKDKNGKDESLKVKAENDTDSKDVGGWWDKIKGWFSKDKNGKDENLKVTAENDTSSKDVGSWWDKIKGWFGKDKNGKSENLKVSAENNTSTKTVTGWWTTIKNAFDKDSNGNNRSLKVTAENGTKEKTVTGWWSTISGWFSKDKNGNAKKLSVSAQDTTKESSVRTWWSTISGWFSKDKNGNKKTLKVNSENGTEQSTVEKWWTTIKGWFSKDKNGKKENLKVKAENNTKQTTVESWWSTIKGWFGKDKNGKKENLKVKATNNTSQSTVDSWWNAIKSLWGSKTLKTKATITEINVAKDAVVKGAVSAGTSMALDVATKGATGGVVTRATNMIVGEAGPEAIIPLKNNTEWLDTVSKYVVSHLNAGKINIPKLAAGQVIPPNREFIAMLGDQTSGTNVESPLSTIEEALANVFDRYLGQMQSPIYVQLNGRTIAEAVTAEQLKRTRQAV